MEKILKKLNSEAKGAAQTYIAVLADAAEFAGERITINGVLSSAPAEAATRDVADGRGGFVAVATGDLIARFDGDAEGTRSLKRLPAGSEVQVSVAEVA